MPLEETKQNLAYGTPLNYFALHCLSYSLLSGHTDQFSGRHLWWGMRSITGKRADQGAERGRGRGMQGQQGWLHGQ